MGGVALTFAERRSPHVVVGWAAARADSFAQNLIKQHTGDNKTALQTAKTQGAKVIWAHPLAQRERF